MLFIFDMGGVVSGNASTIPAMAKLLGLGEPDFLAFCGVNRDESTETRYERGALARIQSGKIDAATFWSEFRDRAETLFGAGHPALERIRETLAGEDPWARVFAPEPIDDTLAVIDELKKRGYRVVCGTNTLDAHYRIHRRSGDYARFDRVYASHLMGLIKPDPAFWEEILREEGVEPGKAAFVDDNPVNVAAAGTLGIAAFRYETPEGLRKDLAPWLDGTRGDVQA